MFVKTTLQGLARSLIVISLLSSCPLWAAESEQMKIERAQFSKDGQLLKPENLDRWIHLGSNMGQGYNQKAFDINSPGTFQIVEMEPTAYDYFKKHGRYADGTMIALSFYKSESKTNPRLNGFSQGDLASFEIHLLDKQKYSDGRAFFNFGMKDRAPMIEAGNRCVECHHAEAEFDGTFTQFYPKIQTILSHHNQ